MYALRDWDPGRIQVCVSAFGKWNPGRIHVCVENWDPERIHVCVEKLGSTGNLSDCSVKMFPAMARLNVFS